MGFGFYISNAVTFPENQMSAWKIDLKSVDTQGKCLANLTYAFKVAGGVAISKWISSTQV